MSKCHFLILVLLCLPLLGGDTVRPGLEDFERRPPCQEEMELINALKEPFFACKDVSAAMQDWFDGCLLDYQKKDGEARRHWMDGLGKLQNLENLAPVTWGEWPDASFTRLDGLALKQHPNVVVDVVSWKVDGLVEYGVVMAPKKQSNGTLYPLILYCHGAAFGLPGDFLNALALLVEQGYVVIGPAMRGEPLFQWQFPVRGEVRVCQGEIENLDGEVDDCLSMLSAAWKLPYVRPNEFAVLGHSFGAGVGLLAAARGGAKAKAVVSYDAWLVNPQRYYWDRMRRAARNWDSWEDYCNQPVLPQLEGLKKRSIIANAAMLECPLLLFMGGAYDGSVFHLSHGDFRKVLDALGKDYRYELIGGGGHNFVLYRNSEQARKAWTIQSAFLKRHYPPSLPKAE